MNYKSAKSMKMWKGNGNTTTLLFFLKGLEILYQGRRGQVNTITLQQSKSLDLLSINQTLLSDHT